VPGRRVYDDGLLCSFGAPSPGSSPPPAESGDLWEAVLSTNAALAPWAQDHEDATLPPSFPASPLAHLADSVSNADSSNIKASSWISVPPLLFQWCIEWACV
jgi:hypothetical protein